MMSAEKLTLTCLNCSNIYEEGQASFCRECGSYLKKFNTDIRAGKNISMNCFERLSEIDVVINSLRDFSPEVRLRTLKNLHYRAHWFLLQILELLQDEEPLIRREAVAIIGTLDYLPIFQILIRHLKDTDPGVRLAIFKILGNIDRERALPYFMEFLGDEDDDIRNYLCTEIGRVGIKKATEIFKKIGKNEYGKE